MINTIGMLILNLLIIFAVYFAVVSLVLLPMNIQYWLRKRRGYYGGSSR